MQINQMNTHLQMLVNKLGDMYERVNANKCLKEYANSDEELSTKKMTDAYVLGWCVELVSLVNFIESFSS